MVSKTNNKSTAVRMQEFKGILSKYGIAFVLLAMIAVMVILKPHTFPTSKNILNILNQSAIVGIMALGMTLVIVSKGIDLSVGSVLALAGTVAASLAQTDAAGIKVFENLGPLPFFIPILAALAVGFLAGAINGALIAYTKIPAFIATLGMMTVARGAVFLYTGGQPVSKLSEGMLFFGRAVFDYIPIPIIIYAGLIAIAWMLLSNTRFGKNVYAIGGNIHAAEISGVKVNKNLVMIYAFMGLMAGVAALIFTGRVASIHPGAATGYELKVIAATTIGGTSHSGGIGTIWGAVVGSIILSVMANGFTLLGVNPYWQQIVEGCIIVAAVIFDMRKNAKKA